MLVSLLYPCWFSVWLFCQLSRWVLRSVFIVVHLSVFPYISIGFYFTYFVALLLSAYRHASFTELHFIADSAFFKNWRLVVTLLWASLLAQFFFKSIGSLCVSVSYFFHFWDISDPPKRLWFAEGSSSFPLPDWPLQPPEPRPPHPFPASSSSPGSSSGLMSGSFLLFSPRPFPTFPLFLQLSPSS